MYSILSWKFRKCSTILFCFLIIISYTRFVWEQITKNVISIGGANHSFNWAATRNRIVWEHPSTTGQVGLLSSRVANLEAVVYLTCGNPALLKEMFCIVRQITVYARYSLSKPVAWEIRHIWKLKPLGKSLSEANKLLKLIFKINSIF